MYTAHDLVTCGAAQIQKLINGRFTGNGTCMWLLVAL